MSIMDYSLPFFLRGAVFPIVLCFFVVNFDGINCASMRYFYLFLEFIGCKIPRVVCARVCLASPALPKGPTEP